MNPGIARPYPRIETPVQKPLNGNCSTLLEFAADEHPANGAQPASILLADGCAVTRRGLRVLLENEPGWKVTAEASSGHEAIQKAIQLRPDVILLTVTMRELNGLDATRLILKAVPHARVLVLSSYQTDQMIGRALQAGVRGYVLKSDAEADLVAAVKALLKGSTFFTPAASTILMEHLRKGNGEKTDRGLTVREAEIVQLLGEGNSNKQVAAILNISSRTVENHRAQIMQRLGLRSFSELIRYAIRMGIIEP